MKCFNPYMKHFNNNDNVSIKKRSTYIRQKNNKTKNSKTVNQRDRLKSE